MHIRSESAPALLNRQREREALDDLVADLRSGRGWALVVRGEAGVGKSALLEYAVGRRCLKLATAMLEQTNHLAAEIVNNALESAELAHADLLELARGIMPAALGHSGLRAAVRSLLHNIALPVSVEVMPDRLPAHVETTAYFVVAEALANTVKHASATGATIRAAVRHGALELEIRDDGAGGADPRHGTGLAGLADRVESIDGTITITSPLESEQLSQSGFRPGDQPRERGDVAPVPGYLPGLRPQAMKYRNGITSVSGSARCSRSARSSSSSSASSAMPCRMMTGRMLRTRSSRIVRRE